MPDTRQYFISCLSDGGGKVMQRLQEEERPKRKHQISWIRLSILISAIFFILVGAVLWILSTLGIISTIWTTITSIIFVVLGILFSLIVWLFPLIPQHPSLIVPQIALSTSSQHPTASNKESVYSINTNTNRNEKLISIARAEQRNPFKTDRQQTYMTLLIALQILAFGVLLFAFTETTALTNPSQSYFYVPHFASFLILLTILSTINLKVLRLSVFQISLLHFLTIFEIIAYRFFNNLLVWLFCVGFVFIIEGFFQFINSYYINKEFRSPRSTNLRVLRKSFSLKIIIYPTFGAIFLLL